MRRSPAYDRFLTRLNEAVDASGLTQRELGERMKMPQSRIWEMLHGERRIDAIEFARLAKILKRSMKWFVG